MMESLMERGMSDGDWARPARYAMCKGKTSAGFALISLCQMSRTHTSHTRRTFSVFNLPVLVPSFSGT